MIISMTLTITAIVLGFWSYAIALRSTIRIKYFNREFNQRLSNAILLFLIFAILMGLLAYLVVLLLKNNIHLF